MANTPRLRFSRFPRARVCIPVLLTLDDGKKRFEATVCTVDISLSGVFFASEFFLKPGTVLDMEFKMPDDHRTVRTRGVIVREVRLDKRGSGAKTQAGFAMRFLEYYGDAETVIASSFVVAELEDFIQDYLSRRSERPKTESGQLRDVIIAWELSKMERKEGEIKLVHDRVQADKDARIPDGGSRPTEVAAKRKSAAGANRNPARQDEPVFDRAARIFEQARSARVSSKDASHQAAWLPGKARQAAAARGST
jgi:hypothetical protein